MKKGETGEGLSTVLRHAGEDILCQGAFDNSFQANIICTVSSGRIIMANNSACELLEYSKEELLCKRRANIFNIKESSFKKMLKQRSAHGRSTALVSVTKKSNKLLQCEITSAVFTQNGSEKSITTIVDVSKKILRQKKVDAKKKRIAVANMVIAQTKSAVKLAENRQWIKDIARTSFDVMWDWDVATGDIYVGDSISEVFGYKVENNTANFRDLRSCIPYKERIVFEKKLVEVLASHSKSWSDSFTFKRDDGSFAFTTSRASVVRNDEGKAIRLVGAMQDISRLQELENKLEEQKDNRDNTELSRDVLWEWNILTDEVCVGEGIADLLGNAGKINNSNIIDWRTFLHPDDKDGVEKGLQRAVQSSDANWQHACRLQKADGSTVKIFNRASIFRRGDEAYQVVGVMHDLSLQNGNKSQTDGLVEDKKSRLTGKIKEVVFELVYGPSEKLQINFSDYLSTKLQYDYTYLSNLFSQVEGISIQQYIIAQKIERAKGLVADNELSLTEIASKLQYSSVGHLSNQFKKVTSLTPTAFKQLKNRN